MGISRKVWIPTQHAKRCKSIFLLELSDDLQVRLLKNVNRCKLLNHRCMTMCRWSQHLFCCSCRLAEVACEFVVSIVVSMFIHIYPCKWYVLGRFSMVCPCFRTWYKNITAITTLIRQHLVDSSSNNHVGRCSSYDKFAAISQTFSIASSWMKMYERRLEFHWNVFLRFQINQIPSLSIGSDNALIWTDTAFIWTKVG